MDKCITGSRSAGRPATAFRSGAGVAMGMVMGIIVVLALLLAIQHMMGANTRQETAAAYLGNRAQGILESALDETTFRIFGEANGLTDQRDLGVALRNFRPEKPGTRERSGYVEAYHYSAKRTRTAFHDDRDVDVADTTYGILEQEPLLPVTAIKSNENQGVLGVEGQVTVRLPGASVSLTRRGRYELEYRSVVLDVPYPFNRYTFFDRAVPAQEPDRFYRMYDQYVAIAQKSKDKLDPYPVMGMDPASGAATDPSTGPVYSMLAHMGDGQYGYRGYRIPAFFGEDVTGGTPAEELSNQLLLMARQEFRRATAKEARSLEPYYAGLEEEAWKRRRTHVYPGLAAFLAAHTTDGVLELNGIYWIDGPVALDHAYRGHGVLVTPHPEGITIRKATRDENVEGRLTLVALRGDIRAAGEPARLDASLMAVHGTVRNLGHTKVSGTVYVCTMPPGKEEGPEIEKPADGDWEPVTRPEQKASIGLARRMRVFISPRPVRRDFTVARGRV